MSRPSAEKSNSAVLLSVVTSGPELIRTGGARPSTLHSHSAGVSSTLPSASTARTRNECSPKTRSLYVTGDEHAVKTRPSAASSSAHSNVPAELFARTRSSWGPARSPVSWYGDEQELNAAPSSEHSKSASGSFDEK